MHYINIIEGCCISSHVHRCFKHLLKLHGINVNITKGILKECYNPRKNIYYEKDMTTYDLLSKTFENEENIVMTLPSVLIDDSILTLLKKNNVRLCFLTRENILDVAICRFKDFNFKSQRKDTNFHNWRKSDERKNMKIEKDNFNKIINKMNMAKNNNNLKFNLMKENFEQKEFITTEDLCNLSFKKWSNLFEIMGLKLEKEIFNNYFKDTVVREPKSHADNFHKEDIPIFKKKLIKNKMLKYWR